MKHQTKKPRETLLAYYDESSRLFTISVMVDGQKKHYRLYRPIIDIHGLRLKKNIQRLESSLRPFGISETDIKDVLSEEAELHNLSLHLW